MPVNHNGVNAIRDGKAVWEPPTIDPLRDAARRALESLNDLILDSRDPGPEATAARLELEQALAAAPAPVSPAPADRCPHGCDVSTCPCLACEADQTALRDRIAAAIWERQNPGRRWADCEYRWRADAEADADAVLAVLPEPVDRTAILRGAADTVDAMNEGCSRRQPCGACNAREDAADSLRRMADEAQATPCSQPNPCENGGDPCTTHERERAHAEGDHGLCGAECTADRCTCDSEDHTHDGGCPLYEPDGEAQQPETQAEIECANCWREVENRSTPNMGGPPRDKWVHVPGGFTVCFPQRGADSPRAEPKPAAVSQPDEEA